MNIRKYFFDSINIFIEFFYNIKKKKITHDLKRIG